jgi:serine/threonine protein kinase
VAAPSGAVPAHASIGSLRHRANENIKGRYQVLEPLGGGSFGTVYRVRDLAVGVDLACKEMHVLDDPATAKSERDLALEWFKREALNLATVRHPHIPAAYFEQDDGVWRVCPVCGLSYQDAGFCPEHGAALLTVEGRFYLMMDFVDGPTLEDQARDHLKTHGRPIDEESALGWTSQIATALRALHRVGIVHRDVKPENIKIRAGDGAAILLDFGLTRKAEEAGGYGTARLSGTTHMGTPGYAPPDPKELTRPDARSDIYALGMALFRLLSARDPQDPAQLAEMRAKPPRSFNAHISPAVEAVISRATQADRTRRYASIDEMLDDLSPLSSSSPSGVAPFVFADGTRARTPLELARLLETHAEEALNYGWNGLFEQWLLAGGYAGAAQGIAQAKTRFPSHGERAVEAMRRVLLRTAGRADESQAQVLASPAELDFGPLDSGEASSMLLSLRLDGGALGFGSVECEVLELPPSADASSVASAFGFERSWQIARGQAPISTFVNLDTTRLPNGSYAGELRWLDEGGAGGAASARGEVAARVAWKFEVRALDLRLEPPSLDLGRVTLGTRVARRVRIVAANEASRGVARGALWVSRALGPVVAPARVEGAEPWEVEVDAARKEAFAGRYEGALHIDTNGGRLRLPLSYEIVLPFERAVGMVAGRVFGCAVGAGLARWAYALVNPAWASQWLSEAGTISPPTLSGYGAPMLLGALAGLLAETLRHSREQNNAPANATSTAVPPGAANASGAAGASTAARRGMSPLVQSALLATVLGALLGWPLLWLMHWVFWGAGDWLLRPLETAWGPFVRALSIEAKSAAPWAWSLAGAVGGALWGAERLLAVSNRATARYTLLGRLRPLRVHRAAERAAGYGLNLDARGHNEPCASSLCKYLPCWF